MVDLYNEVQCKKFLNVKLNWAEKSLPVFDLTACFLLLLIVMSAMKRKRDPRFILAPPPIQI